MRQALRHGLLLAALLGGAHLAPADVAPPTARLLYSDSAATAAEFYVKALRWQTAPAPADSTEITLVLPGGATVRTLKHDARRAGYVATRWIPIFAAGSSLDQLASRPDLTNLAEDEQGWVGLDPLGSPLGIAALEHTPDPRQQVRPSIWPVLLTPQPAVALEFYAQLLDWTAQPDARTPLFEGDFIWSRDGRRQAGLTYQAPGPAPADQSSGWLLLFGVADLDAAVKTCWRAGARIVREPGVDLIGGRVAVLTDPAGAAFGLYELVPTPGPSSGKHNLQIRPATP